MTVRRFLLAASLILSAGLMRADDWSTSTNSAGIITGGTTEVAGCVSSDIYVNDLGVLTCVTPVNGQLLIGSGLGSPALGTLTGTANQVNVTNGQGSITLSLPQSIGTTSNPSFSSMTVTYGISAGSVTVSGSGSPTIVSTYPSVAVTVGGNTYTIDDAVTTSSKAFTLQGNGFNAASLLVKLDSSARYPALDGSLIMGIVTGSTAAETAAGWVTDSATWTGLSATQFTISVDATGYLQPGDKVTLVQSATTKYFTVTAVSFAAAVTTVTVSVSADYTLAVGVGTSTRYTHTENPVGFPDWFNFTTTFGGFSAAPTPATIRYKVVGRQVFVRIYSTAAGTSNANTFTFTVPITSKNETVGTSSTGDWGALATQCVDNSALVSTTACPVILPGNSATVNVYKTGAQGTWTTSGGKGIQATFSYEF